MGLLSFSPFLPWKFDVDVYSMLMFIYFSRRGCSELNFCIYTIWFVCASVKLFRKYRCDWVGTVCFAGVLSNSCCWSLQDEKVLFVCVFTSDLSRGALWRLCICIFLLPPLAICIHIYLYICIQLIRAGSRVYFSIFQYTITLINTDDASCAEEVGPSFTLLLMLTMLVRGHIHFTFS